MFADPVQVDGTEGIKVETTSKDLSRPKFAVVVFRDEKVYLIMAAQKPGTDVSQAFDEVVKSHWEIMKTGDQGYHFWALFLALIAAVATVTEG